MTNPPDQADVQRRKQQWIRRQVKAGKLVVRQMTPEERAAFPVPEATSSTRSPVSGGCSLMASSPCDARPATTMCRY